MVGWSSDQQQGRRENNDYFIPSLKEIALNVKTAS